jgi:hypothetical protein
MGKADTARLVASYLSPTDMSSANNLHTPSITSAMSLIDIENNRGPSTDPWVTPAGDIDSLLLIDLFNDFF